ncbi:hypothetical protein SAMN05421593_1230 [Chryseobacterium culicis]|uniref:Uncharacterized protein n=1 Tax=Chryseobacterium culicis TaxID=680127 RepID=A0A1H6H3V2_CHRCI|nr:hypothetical protein SAMN05421593_1230 [Chryseobacterium culicis]
MNKKQIEAIREKKLENMNKAKPFLKYPYR